MKRIICLSLVLLLIIGIFSACGNDNAAVPSVPGNVADDGMFVYSITRSATAAASVESSAKTLRSSLKKGLNCNVVFLKDTVSDYDENYEILVGNTNRPESAEAVEILKNNRPNNNHDFIVKVIGDKIVIAATTDSMIDLACRWFVKTFGTTENWQLLKEDYEFIFTPDDSSIVNTANGNNIGYYSLVVPKQWSYLCGREVDKIAETMETAGYSMEKIIDGNDVTRELEIIFGDTEREESKAVQVEENNYVIKVSGNKIVIKGGNDLANYQAINDFKVMLENANKENKPLNLADGTVINGTYDASKDGTYTLNFGDEFNGSTLNFKKWSNYGSKYSETNSTGASCLGGSCYDARYDNTDFVGVKDGSMYYSAKKISDTDFRGTSISSCFSMIYRYGFWEVREQMPETPATVSLWTNAAYLPAIKPAMGDLSREGFTEIDLVETFGSPNSFASNVHRWFGAMNAAGEYEDVCAVHTSLDGEPEFNSPGNDRRYKLAIGNIYDDFHIYSYYWDDECMEFAFDGNVYCKYNYADQKVGTSIHCMQNFIIMSCYMGSASYGTKWKEGMPEASTGYIDYTRIYQTNAINSQMRLGGGFSLEGNYDGKVSYVYPEVRMSE